FLSACQELFMKPLIGGQMRYHADNSERLDTVDHRLHLFGVGLFFVTLAARVIHLVVALAPGADTLSRWLSFFAGLPPALGAAMQAIRSQGEFHRVVRRSRAMSEALKQLGLEVGGVPVDSGQLNSQSLQEKVEETTRLMYDEVLDWRIVFQDRPLD